MQQHPTAEGLLKQACATFKHLTMYNCGHRIRIAQAGGIERILHTMREYPTAEGLLIEACAALGNLCANNDNNKRLIGKAGGVKVLVDTMKQNSTATNAQEEATFALFNLSLDNNNKNEIAQTATEAVKEAQKTFSISPVSPQGAQKAWSIRCRQSIRYRTKSNTLFF